MNNIQTKFPHISIKLNEPLSKYTYTKTGGNADIFVMPKTTQETQEIVSYCHLKNIPLTILGNGSNLIIKDGGIRGVIVHLDLLQSMERKNTQVTAMSGAKLIDTAKFALEESLSGLEFACGIPGSIGGALHMNAGAYGGEISDCLEAATVLTQSGELKKLKRSELKAAYRFSTIAEKNYIVLDATFSLKLDDKNNIQTKMDELTAAREAKQPLEYPSCGSVFKRPPGHFAGKLIQDSGLQGHIIGGAQVSLKHAGFIVNIGGATATDYMNLIAYVQKTVREKFDVELETEVKIIGEDK